MLRTTILSAAILLLAGCGGEAANSPKMAYDNTDSMDSPAGAESTFDSQTPTLASIDTNNTVNQPAENEQQPANAGETETAPPDSPVQRKIIYNATVSIVVPKLETTRQEVKKLVADAGGHIQQFSEQKTYGDRLSGRWVVRIPATKFDDFLAAVVDLGVPESQNIEANEVTAEFYDLDARLNTLRQVERDMLKIMDQHADEVADLLEAQRQLGQVRVDIERIEGRLRQLKDLVALSTVTIDAREDENYTPPQAPTFGERIAHSFGASIETMQRTGEALVLTVVVLAPWALAGVIFLLIPLLIVIAVIRRRMTPRPARA
jgi:hypothetical protein